MTTLSGCSSGPSKPAAQPQAQPPAPACRQPAPADLPDTAGQVSETDTGAFCLGTNQQLDAFLTSPAAGTRWSQIKTSDETVLGDGDNSVLTTPVTVTAGVFVARKPGTALLTSALPNGRAWSVTIVVR